MIEKAFLYIDILGFTDLVTNQSEKVREIFKIVDKLNVHNKENLKVIMFSDTILVFTLRESLKINWFVSDMVEYAQELFYKLNSIGIFFKAVIAMGEFEYSRLKHIQSYYGKALIEAYHDTNSLEGFGLYIHNEIASWPWRLQSVKFTQKYQYVLLCSSLVNLYRETNGVLPINNNLLERPDDYCEFCNLDSEITFLETISNLKDNFPVKKVREKYKTVFNIYQKSLPNFLGAFEKRGFCRNSLY